MPFRGPRLPLLLLLLLLPRSLQPGRLADAAPAPAAGLNLSDDFARLHPAYHLAQPRGWLNDPNGLLFFKGVWHVFYQADAALSPIPLRQGWAHAASRDLAHWVRLPFALRPGPEPYDAGGVWTGGATVVDGVPRILYTCVSGPAFSFQQQCAAVPADPGDPLLRAWTKLGPVPTLALPPGGTHSQFRDPTAGLAVAAAAPQQRPRRPRAGRPARSRWLVLVGAQVGCRGAAALYTSPDLQNFSYRGLLYAQPGSASQPLLLGLPCDQYGAAQGGGAMWETPGLFEVRGSGASNASAVVFKYGVQLAGADQFATDYYAAGDLEEQPGGGASFRPRGPFAPLDGGRVYAGQALAAGSPAAGGAPLLWLWAQETAPRGGRDWQGALTLPRALTLSPSGDRILQAYPPELRALRAGGGGGAGAPPSAEVFELALPAGGAAVPLPLGPAAVSAAGTQLEVQLNVSCAPPDAAALGCAAGVLLTTSPAGALGPRTAVLLTLPGLQTTREARLTVDRSATGGPGDARPQSAAWPAAAAGAGLTLYVDHSVLEAVAGDGFAAVTSRIYPDAAAPGAGGGDRAAWGLALVATRGSATVSARVWALGGAFVDEL